MIVADELQHWKEGTEDVSIYAASSRAKDLSDLPQAFIDVGSCKPFRDEDVAYATKLWECGVQCELHVWPGAW
jgi:acetyl esterase/lipase